MRSNISAKRARRQSLVPGKLILASSSPQRKRLLTQAGFKFTVQKSGYRENLQLPLPPRKLAMFLALGKARAIAEKHKEGVVIAADTIVVLGGKVFGKPSSNSHAKRMLTELSGKKHQVITGIAIVDVQKQKTRTFAVATSVTFLTLSGKTIEQYVESAEGMRAAGAYAYQKKGKKLVRSVRGSVSNVIGLPMEEVSRKLRAFST